jgi:hypothetical protein
MRTTLTAQQRPPTPRPPIDFFLPSLSALRWITDLKPELRGQMTDAAPITVTVVTSQFEAELIVGLLRDNGLDAFASADDAGGQEPQLQLQGVRVLVARTDESAARQILADAESGQLES